MQKTNNSETGNLPPKTVFAGVPWTPVRMEFKELKMDADFAWKLTFSTGHGADAVAMGYDLSIVYDTTDFDAKLERLYAKATSEQTSLECATGHVANQMRDVHQAYWEKNVDFDGVAFQAEVIKFENKKFGERTIQVRILRSAALMVSNLWSKLERCSIVMNPMSAPLGMDQ